MSIDLHDIVQQVEQDNITAARNMIQAYLKENPKNEQGWVAAFNIFHKKENKMYCLERLLTLNPNNTQAAALLEKMQDPTASTTSIQTQAKPVMKKKATRSYAVPKKVEQADKSVKSTSYLSKEQPKSQKESSTPPVENIPIPKQEQEYSFFDPVPMPSSAIPNDVLEQQLRGDKHLVLAKALKKNDTTLIRALFKEEAEVIAIGLEELLLRQLIFKYPPKPKLRANVREFFDQAKYLAQTNDPQDVREAAKIIQEIWVEDIDNPGLRAWMAFLQLQLGDFQEGAKLLRSVLRLQDPKFDEFALWNLAVLAFKEKADKLAFQLVLLLLEENKAPTVLTIAIALAVKRGAIDLFFSLMPHVWHLQYHPLAIYLAAHNEDLANLHNCGEVYLKQADWQPLPPGHRFEQAAAYKKVIGQAIVSRSIQRLIAWLRARIAISKIYVPDYLALSDVLEKEDGNIEGAFEVLIQRLEIRKLTDTQKDIACRDLIECSIRSNRDDLKRIAFDTIQYSYGNRELLKNIEHWGFLPAANRATLQQHKLALPNTYKKDQLALRLDNLENHLAGIAAYTEIEEAAEIITPTTSISHEGQTPALPEYALFIDHENIIKSLEEIRKAFGYPIPANPKKQFALDLAKMVIAVEQRLKRKLTHKVAVSFWNRVPEKEFQYVYISQGFVTAQPASIKKENAVDFQLVEEMHQFWRTTAIAEDKYLQQIVILTGDGDFSAIAQSAKAAGIQVQVWGGRKGFGEKFRNLLGAESFVLLEDVFAPKMAYKK